MLVSLAADGQDGNGSQLVDVPENMYDPVK